MVVAALLVAAAIFTAVQHGRLGHAQPPAGPDDPPQGGAIGSQNVIVAHRDGRTTTLSVQDLIGG